MVIKKESVSLLFLFIVFSSLSCSSIIKVSTPSSRFISPEAIGETFKSELQLFIPRGTKAEVNLSKETTDEPLVLSDNKDNTGVSSLIGGNINMGLYKDLDVLFLKAGNATPSYAGVRYQIIGKNKRKAKAKNHALSFIALVGGGSTLQKNDDAVELTPKDEEAEVALEFNSSDFSLVYGYRTTDRFMVYGGVSTTTTSFTGVMSAKSTLLDQETLSNTGRMDGYHVGISYDIGTRGFIKVEHSGQKVNWRRSPVRSFNFTSAALGFYIL